MRRGIHAPVQTLCNPAGAADENMFRRERRRPQACNRSDIDTHQKTTKGRLSFSRVRAKFFRLDVI